MRNLKVKTVFVSLIGMAILVASIVVTMQLIKNKPVHTGTPAKTPSLVVNSTIVSPSDNQVIIESDAIVKAKVDSVISAQLSGTITYVSAKLEAGYIVEKGDILFKLDDSDYLANLASAKAAIATAEKNLEEEQALATQAKRDQVRAGIKSISDYAKRVPQIAEAKANLESSKAQYEKAKIDLARSEVKAPFTGLVMTREVDIGEYVSTGTALVQLVDLKTFKVDIALNSTEVNLIANSPSAKITLINNEGEKWQTYIDTFAPTIDTQNRTLSVSANIQSPYQNPQKPLRLESYVDVLIEGDIIKNSVWLENESIVNNQFVWMVDDQYQLQKIPVQIIYNQPKQSLIRFDVDYYRVVKTPLPNFRIGRTVVIKNSDGEFETLENNHVVFLTEDEVNGVNEPPMNGGQR